jgi:hypothetical protein
MCKILKIFIVPLHHQTINATYSYFTVTVIFVASHSYLRTRHYATKSRETDITETVSLVRHEQPRTTNTTSEQRIKKIPRRSEGGAMNDTPVVVS